MAEVRFRQRRWTRERQTERLQTWTDTGQEPGSSREQRVGGL